MITSRTVALIALISPLVACSKKEEAAPAAAPKPQAAATAPGASSPPVQPAPAGAAATAPAPTPTPTPPSAAVCCCESTGDAVHFTLEKDAAACGAPELGGACVALTECGLSASPQPLEPGKDVTAEWDEGGLDRPVLWTPAAGAHVALEVKPAGAEQATVRARVGEDWKTLGKLDINPARGGTVGFAVDASGAVTLTSTMPGDEEEEEVTTWQLRYDAKGEKVVVKR
jgi:hypothetical protein